MELENNTYCEHCGLDIVLIRRREEKQDATIATQSRRLELAEALAVAVRRQTNHECDFPLMDRCGDFTVPCDLYQVMICDALRAFEEVTP
jgi:hypothetical protein